MTRFSVNRPQNPAATSRAVRPKTQVSITVRSPAPPKRVSSSELFGETTTLEIEHGGATYTLRVTAAGKLILTK